MLSNWLIKSNEKPPTTISMLQPAQCSSLLVQEDEDVYHSLLLPAAAAASA